MTSTKPLPAIAVLRRRLRPSAGLATSAALHLIVLTLVLFVVPSRLPDQLQPEPISVELLSPEAFAAMAATRSAETEAEPALDRLPRERPLAPAPPLSQTHVATTFYSASILDEPAMARIRRTLATFANSERVVQLCNIEGLEQIRRAAPQYDPDTLVSYAMADPVSQGLTLIARGAAFRSRRRWYRVSFSCTAAPGLDGVTAFSFELGDTIPESEWEAHNLNAEDSDE